MLLTILCILILTGILVYFSNLFKITQEVSQLIALIGTIICFFMSVLILIFFDRSCGEYQYIFSKFILKGAITQNFETYFSLSKFVVSFGVDGISLFFILLTTFIIPLCILTSYKNSFFLIKDYCFYLLAVEIFLILSFSSMDLMVFFIFFESLLIPMFFIIGIWGSRERRVRAGFLFFLYTLFGSIFLFFSAILLYYDFGTTNFNILSKTNITTDKQHVLWLFSYVAFSVKIPTIPFHIWLPEAHVEAPTAGSVILAGLLLKLGGYGFIRVLIIIFSKSTVFFLPITDSFAVISIIYAALTTIRQIDLKRIVAYSSISHMNLVVLGIFSGNIQGVMGGIFLMLAHGVVSSALFFLIGVLYDRYATRLIYYYGGLVQTMPIFSAQLIIFCFANIGVPGSCNFIGEVVIFVGLVDRNLFILIVAVSGVILSVIYTMIFCNKLVFGNLNINFIFIYSDMSFREICIISPLFFFTIFFGIFPDVIFDCLITSVSTSIEYYNI